MGGGVYPILLGFRIDWPEGIKEGGNLLEGWEKFTRAIILWGNLGSTKGHS